jgi:Ni,Fe-hydrogenase I cytochrome b subunit
MANLDSIMLKTVRLSAWPLLVLMVIYIVTGYALCGQYGLGSLVDMQTALATHKLFNLPLVILLAAHVLSSMYLAFRRWKWIGRPRKT